jgi:hypothetical protein
MIALDGWQNDEKRVKRRFENLKFGDLKRDCKKWPALSQGADPDIALAGFGDHRRQGPAVGG